ncbi:MAG: hypothetical protein QN157_01520 [Armatimonadota bacterium]|nr:hypothetical protein [Armatimonadota bacterium]
MAAAEAGPILLRSTLPAVVAANCYQYFCVLGSATAQTPVRIRRVTVRSQGPHCWVTSVPLANAVDLQVSADEWCVLTAGVLRVSGAAPPGEYVLELRVDLEATGEDAVRTVQEVLRVSVRGHGGCCS